MYKKSIAQIRNTMQFLQRMYDRLYGTPRKWRVIAHFGNLADKALTFIGITMYHLREVNPIGKLFLGEGASVFGIIAFFLFGVLTIEYIHKIKPKILPVSATLLSLAVGMNTYLLLHGA